MMLNDEKRCPDVFSYSIKQPLGGDDVSKDAIR
jgi:hypothetical protein